MIIDTFHIIPGIKCTMKCAHCFSASGPDEKKGGLHDIEIEKIVAEINRYKPVSIILTGGEPTLYAKELSKILEQIEYEHETVLTTNGFYAASLDDISKVLGQFPKLNSIQLSFDRFHNDNLMSEKPMILKKYCEEKNIKFCMIVSISDPKEILWVKRVEEKYKCKVVFQKIDGSGRAKKTNCEFKYPVFDEAVLSRKCPNSNIMSYIQGKGFTPCSGNLIYNIIDSSNYFEESTEKILASQFFQEVTGMTFQERLKKYNINHDDLLPRYSSDCNLCEFIELERSKKVCAC